MTVRTRFSPSPTGKIHLGNARAALFSALYANKHDGKFVLRIEDTDAARSEEAYVDSLVNDMKWLGVLWQEGPQVNGPYAPYWQSQRQDIYAKYYDVLEKKGRIYPCFCSDQELALARKLQLSRGHAPRYGGTCRKLSKEDINEKIIAGKKPAWRFHVQVGEKIEFVDVVKGEQQFSSNDIGDFIVRRADGTAPFLFCNAIDDATMEISHVLRGEDHLTNTPRQIMILRALKLAEPHYGHLSLIVGDDGSPLSKRHGSFSVDQMRDAGFLPQAMMNYLARLGHTMENPNLLDFQQLSLNFNLEKLSRSPARFDTTQLMYWQKIAVQSLSNEALWQWLGEDIKTQVPNAMQTQFAETIKTNIAFPGDAKNWADIFFKEKITFDEDNIKLIQEAGEQYFTIAEAAIKKFGLDLKAVLDDIKQQLNVSGKKLFMPLRVALTGRAHGPELAQIAELLGSEKMQFRLNQAYKAVG